MVPTGIQLYTLRDLKGGLPTLLCRIGETDFDGVEFARFGETSPDKATAVLVEYDLEAAGAHVSIDALEDDPHGAAETFAALNCDRVVVPYLDGSHFESVAAVRETATRLSELVNRLADHGLALSYHNHDHEFVTLETGGRSILLATSNQPILPPFDLFDEPVVRQFD